MEKVIKIKEIEENKDFVRLLCSVGYIKPSIFRDIDVLKDYQDLVNDETEPTEAYKVLAKKYKLTKDYVRYLLKNTSLEI